MCCPEEEPNGGMGLLGDSFGNNDEDRNDYDQYYGDCVPCDVSGNPISATDYPIDISTEYWIDNVSQWFMANGNLSELEFKFFKQSKLLLQRLFTV